MISLTKISYLQPPFFHGAVLTSGINLYSYGKTSISEGINLYSLHYEILTNGINLYSAAHGTSNDGVYLFAEGRNHFENSSLDLYSFGDSPFRTSSLDLYAYVSDIGNFENGVEMFAKVPEGLNLNCIAFGPFNTINNSITLYTYGSQVVTSGLNLSIPFSKTQLDESIILYSCGW